MRDTRELNANGKVYSLNDFFKIDESTLANMVFVTTPQQEQQVVEEGQPREYFSITISSLNSGNSKFQVIKFNNESLSIKFNLNLSEKRLLELVNACVSHEMRNPINGIFGMNVQLRSIITRLFTIIRSLAVQDMEQLDAFERELSETILVQESCAKLLNFYVADLLCLA